MPRIYRPDVKVGSCITLAEMSIELGGTASMLRMHQKSSNFPKMVAVFGHAHLYVKTELDAFYKTVLWRQADRSVKELGEM